MKKTNSLKIVEIENYANNFSKQFMIKFAKSNPNYFNENLIMRKKDELLKYSNKWFYESYRGARFHFYYNNRLHRTIITVL